MTNHEMKQKIDELMSDQDFVKKMADSESYDELADIFSAEGLTVSAEELEAAMDNSEELDLSALEEVAGGNLLGYYYGLLAAKIIKEIKKKIKKKRR